jgi:formylglycine-generating enzyme required for sulfatase activity
MNQSEDIEKKIEPKIKFFKNRYGTAHLYLAYHAAFPLALTPDLLNSLWVNFQSDSRGNVLNIPWIAITDLLFSDLCKEVGYEIYEMEKTVRDALLKDLKNHDHFGVKRIKELSEFLLFYVQLRLDSSDIDIRDLAQAQRWTALVYTQTDLAAKEIASVLAELYKSELKNRTEWARMTSLIKTFSEPLKEGNFNSLLIYITGMYYFIHKNLEKAALNFDQLPGEEQEVEIAGIKLPIPMPKSRISPLFNFEFKIAEIKRKPKKWMFDSEWIIIRNSGHAQYFGEDWGEGVILEMVYIPGGTFRMGSPDGEGDKTEYPQHLVTIAPFFMSKYPVTQTQWRTIAELPKVKFDINLDPAFFKGPHCPVENISWDDAVEFCERLQKKTSKFYRLPTEAEWEYACRGRTETAFHFGETITPKLACYKGKSTTITRRVGFFNIANSFGLYDMHGNVREWCADNWQENYRSMSSKTIVNQKRVVKGGSWSDAPLNCRSASRSGKMPGDRDKNVGFRVVF